MQSEYLVRKPDATESAIGVAVGSALRDAKQPHHRVDQAWIVATDKGAGGLRHQRPDDLDRDSVHLRAILRFKRRELAGKPLELRLSDFFEPRL